MKQELERLKEKLLQKLNRDIQNKYKTLMIDKNIKIDFFNKDFQKEIEKYFEYNNPNYTKLFQQVERIVLNILYQKEDRKRENMLEKKEVENLIQMNTSTYTTDQEQEKHLNMMTNQNKISPRVTSNFDYLPEGKLKRTKLRSELKKKEKDEWAKLNKNDYNNFLSQTKNKDLQNKQLRKLYNEELHRQMLLKMEIENLRKKEEGELLNQIILKSESYVKIEEETKRKNKEDNIKTFRKIYEENNKNKSIVNENKNRLKEEEKRIDEAMFDTLNKENEKMLENLKNKNFVEKELEKYLKNQIEEKRREKDNLTKSKKEEIFLIQNIVEEAEKEKMRAIKNRQELILTYKRDLEEQMQTKEDPPMMNEIEKSFNKKLLEKCN